MRCQTAEKQKVPLGSATLINLFITEKSLKITVKEEQVNNSSIYRTFEEGKENTLAYT